MTEALDEAERYLAAAQRKERIREFVGGDPLGWCVVSIFVGTLMAYLGEWAYRGFPIQ